MAQLSTAFKYLIALLATYFLVYLPLSQPSSHEVAEESECDPESTANLRRSLLQILPETQCREHLYNVHIVHRDPLVIYIPHFLSDDEADHLVNISLPHFAPSTVYDGRKAQINSQVRKSEVALLPDTDTTVQCLADRAQSFQGWPTNTHIEKFRSQRYGPSGHYSHHYDWTGASKSADRISTFMVYLQADCVGGGTNFPSLSRPEGWQWDEWLERSGAGEVDEGEEMEGVTFKPVKGSAVYWENLRPGGGGGYEETWHASLPVREGTKIGLNIWSWVQDCRFEW